MRNGSLASKTWAERGRAEELLGTLGGFRARGVAAALRLGAWLIGTLRSENLAQEYLLALGSCLTPASPCGSSMGLGHDHGQSSL